QTNAGQFVAVGTNPIFTGELVNLVTVLSVYTDRQAGARRLEVIIRLRPRAWPELLLIIPFGNHIVVRAVPATGIIMGCWLTRARIMRGRIIGKDEYMLIFLVLEVIADTLLFHQTCHEVQVCLPILHTVIARRERAAK